MPVLESLTSAVTSIYGNTLLDTSMILSAEYAVFLSFVALAFLWFSGERDSIVLAGATGVLGVATAYTLGFLYSHQGPYVVMETLLQDPVSENAFPSQHTALAFSLAFGLLKRNRDYGLALLFLAVLTGFARFYTGLHWPVDILGGIFAAGIGLLIVHLLEDQLLMIAEPFIEIYEKYSPV